MDEITLMIDKLELALSEASKTHHSTVAGAIEHETGVLYCCYAIDLALEKLTNTVTRGTVERIKALQTNLKINAIVDDVSILKDIYGYE